MAVRRRMVRSEFWHDEDLAELPILSRFLLLGLWAIADRDGRLEDRPRRVKRLLFPADEIDVDGLISQLAQVGFLLRYQLADQRLIQMLRFSYWQRPHPRESRSELPEPPAGYGIGASQGVPWELQGQAEDAPRCRHGGQFPSEPSGPSGASGSSRAQPCSVREGPAPELSTDARASSPSAPGGNGKPPILKTDADLEPILRAWCDGTGQKLTWRQQHIYPCEQIASHGATPDLVRRVATLYRSRMDKGTPSLPRFAAEFDRWRGEVERTQEPSGQRTKTPEDWLREGKCPKHPLESLLDGRCQLCDAIEAGDEPGDDEP